MSNNLKLVINNTNKQIEDKHFFEKDELKIILDLYAKMVSEGSWKDYGLSISSKQVGFSVFKNAAENALYKICKNFRPKNKNLKYLITDTNGKIIKNSSDLNVLLKNTISSAAIAPFLVAPNERQSTPTFHEACAGDINSWETNAFENLAPSI